LIKIQLLKNKVVNPKDNDSIVPYIDLDIKGNALYKNRLMMLDIVNNNWKDQSILVVEHLIATISDERIPST
jgi:hypothetical protein